MLPKALRELNVLRALTVYPFYEEEESNDQMKTWIRIKQKIAKNDRTNIYATNFAWKQ